MSDEGNAPPTQGDAQPAKIKKKPGRHQGDGVDTVKYIQLVNLFRETPGNINRAATTVAINRSTAKRAWFSGWPRKGLRAIKDVIEEEHMLARARMQELEETLKARQAAVELELANQRALGDAEYKQRLKDAEDAARAKLEELLAKAKLDAAETMAHEAQISRSARGTSIALMVLGSHIFASKNLPTIANLFMQAINGQALKPKEAALLLRSLSRFGLDVNHAAKLALDIERERLGKPTEHVQVDVHNMSLKEAIREIDDAKALSDLLREEEAYEAAKPAPGVDLKPVH